MKLNLAVFSGLLALSLSGPALAQDAGAKFDYIDIRWDGTDRMCVVYPDGHVDFVGAELKAIPRPDDTDKRAFYMTIEMNRMAKLGYEFAGIISDVIIMKRAVR